MLSSAVGKLGSQPPRVDPPAPSTTVMVRTLRDHDGPDGMKGVGVEYLRSADDAAYLVSQGTVAIVAKPRGGKA